MPEAKEMKKMDQNRKIWKYRISKNAISDQANS
jgi:hypothetical protein